MANLRAHNPDNYKVQRKVQIFGRPRGSSGPWESFGSIKDVVAELEKETIPHFSNYLGDRVKDREETIQRTCRVDFTFEEFNAVNLRHILGRGWEAGSDGVKDILFDKTVTNPGAGGTINLGKTDIKNLVARSVSLEDDETYDELAFAASGEVAENAEFNNVTSPLTVVAAVTTYGLITFVVGKLFRLGTEILRVTAIAGNDVTFARAQLGTVAAAHANGVAIEEGTGDYHVNLTTGIVTILWAAASALEDEDTVEEIHLSFQQERDVEEFELFPSQIVELEVQMQYGSGNQVEEVWGPITNATLKNNGPISIGDGSDWAGVPMRIEGLASIDSTFGTAGIVKETQS